MSTLRVNTLQDATGSNQPAMAGAAKAWVNFNGTGTVTISSSFNVSSITDNNTGDYTINFTNAMPDTTFAAVASSGNSFSNPPGTVIYTALAEYSASRTTSSVRIIHGYVFGTSYNAYDVPLIAVAVFR